MSVKLNDIAKAAGVSPATVSMALNGNSAIREVTREKIRRIADEMGYVPNQFARKLAGKVTKSIGISVPDIENLQYSGFIRSITEIAHANGGNISLAISGNTAEGEEHCLRDLLQQRVDAIIVIPIPTLSCGGDRFRVVKESGVPCIFALSKYPDVDLPTVMCDIPRAFEKALRYAKELNYCSPTLIVGPESGFLAGLVTEGFSRGITAFPENPALPSDKRVFHAAGGSYEDGRKTALYLYNHRIETDVILVETDVMGIGVINALKSFGIEIPEDVAVISFGNTLLATVAPIPLTSVDPASAKIAEEAFRALFSPEEQSPPVLLVEAKEIAERKSTSNYYCNIR